MRSYRPGRVLRRVFRVRFPSRLYDRNLGWLLTRRVCRLTHVGRTSGKRYRTVLEVIGTDPQSGEVLIISGLGPTADWYRNLRANSVAEVETGRRHFVAYVRVPDVDEAVRRFADYERRNRLIAPLMRHLLSKLVGWRYDGSESARRKLVEQLPILALGPT